MILTLLAVAIGVFGLALSADQFVIGAARVALLRNVPSLVVGVVIVGFGTSAPEALVSTIAAASGQPAVAVGNIVGSNIANLSLLLGIGAIIVPLDVSSRIVKREAPIVLAAVILLGFFVRGGGLNRIEGVVMLVALAAALSVVMRSSPGDPIAEDVVELTEPAAHRIGPELLRTFIGLVGTIGAAQLLLWGALDLADRAQLSEGFVGVTLVAVGTSLPEFVTVIQSGSRRKETDLIVGNLLGSNLFNALGVGGLVGLVGAASFDAPALATIGVGAMVVVSLAAFAVMFTGHSVSRREGAALIAGYVALLPFLT